MRRIVLYSIVLHCIASLSCNDHLNDDASISVIEAKNHKLHWIAKTLTLSMQQSPKFRKLIREQALNQFDFQHDVLYKRIADEPLENSTVKELMTKNYEKVTSRNDFEEIVSSLHYLQFSIPVHCEEWNTSFVPLVVPLPVDRDEEQTKTLTAYTTSLEAVTISAKTPPYYPVVCVSEAERIDENGMLMVTQDGIVLPPANRLPLKEALAITYPNFRHNLKSAIVEEKKIPKMVEILSDDSFKVLKDRIERENRMHLLAKQREENDLYEYLKIHNKKLKSATYKTFTVTGMSDLSCSVYLEWNSPNDRFNNTGRVYVP